MQFKLITLTAALLTGLSSALVPVGTDALQLRQACGVTNGKCNANGCQGLNDPIRGIGRCTEDFKDCPCTSVCGSLAETGPCNRNGCNGVRIADFPTPIARCTAGEFNGCFCFI